MILIFRLKEEEEEEEEFRLAFARKYFDLVQENMGRKLISVIHLVMHNSDLYPEHINHIVTQKEMMGKRGFLVASTNLYERVSLSVVPLVGLY